MFISLLSRDTGTLPSALPPCPQDLGGTGSSAAGEAGAPTAGRAGGAAAASGDAAVRAVLTDLLGRLPAPFSLVDIESRVKTRTPFTVLALQVGGVLGAGWWGLVLRKWVGTGSAAAWLVQAGWHTRQALCSPVSSHLLRPPPHRRLSAAMCCWARCGAAWRS